MKFKIRIINPNIYYKYKTECPLFLFMRHADNKNGGRSIKKGFLFLLFPIIITFVKERIK